MSTDGTGWEISPIFAHRNAAKQTVHRSQKRKEKALKPSGFKAFPMAGAEGLEVASQPRLRCPKRPMLAFTRAVSTAAPTPARCIRHRRREQALPGTRLWRGCRGKDDRPKLALLRRLPPAETVFDAIEFLLRKGQALHRSKDLFCSRRRTLCRSKNMLSRDRSGKRSKPQEWGSDDLLQMQ